MNKFLKWLSIALLFSIVSIGIIPQMCWGDAPPTPASDLITPKWENDAWVEGISLVDIKVQKITETKAEASALLSGTDWQVIRHRDQIEISGLETSLTTEEYEQLLADRQAIRNTSNVIEAEINALTTVQDVKDYVIDYEISGV